jgi:hypothetical protein
MPGPYTYTLTIISENDAVPIEVKTVQAMNGSDLWPHLRAPVLGPENARGLLEVIPYFDSYEGKPCLVIGDEEAKVHPVPKSPNRRASFAWYHAMGRQVRDYLAGTMVVVQGDIHAMNAMRD